MADNLKRIKDFVIAVEHGDFTMTLPETSEGELGELEKAVNRLVKEFRRARWDQDHRAAFEKELRVSRAIQSSLLPLEMPAIQGAEMGALYRPANEIGGDYYDFIDVDPDHLGIAIADVSGKSISAAMLMAVTRNTLRAQAMLTLSPREVLQRTGRLLISSMAPGLFVSMFYAVLDRQRWTLSCANAGHPPILFYHNAANRSEWIRPKGIAVGLLRNNEGVEEGWGRITEEVEVGLEGGDMILLYTDGVTEALGADGSRFGREGIVEVVQRSGRLGASAFLSTLENRLLQFSAGQTQTDDIAAVVLQRK